jgi:hypothetical protein
MITKYDLFKGKKYNDFAYKFQQPHQNKYLCYIVIELSA